MTAHHLRSILYSTNSPRLLVGAIPTSNRAPHYLPSPHSSTIPALAPDPNYCVVLASSPAFSFYQGQTGLACHTRQCLVASATSGIAAWAAAKVCPMIPISSVARFQMMVFPFPMAPQPIHATRRTIPTVSRWALHFQPVGRTAAVFASLASRSGRILFAKPARFVPCWIVS